MSEVHAFNVRLAKEYGVTEAILINHFIHIIKYNKTHNRHSHDGKTWMNDSLTSLCELYPYMSESTIKRAIKHLKAEKVIASRNDLNTHPSIRTGWYALANEDLFLGCQNGKSTPDVQCTSSVDSDIPLGQNDPMSLGQNDPMYIEVCNSMSKELSNIPLPSQSEDETDNLMETILPPLETPFKERINLCYKFAMRELQARPNNSSLTTPKSWKKTLDGWMGALDKLERLDGVGAARIAEIHRKVVKDVFWSKQVRSIPKYRQKDKEGQPYYERLAVEMGL